MSKLFSPRLPAWAGFTLLLLALVLPASAQQSRTLDIGAMGYTTNEVVSNDDIEWPRDLRHMDREVLDTYGITIGVRNTFNFVTPDGSNPPYVVAQVMQNKFSDIEKVTVPVAGAFKRVHRVDYPTKILDGQEWTRQFDKTDPVDPDLPSDAMIYVQFNAWNGIQVERWTYAFANDRYDDFVIHEYRFTNTSNSVRDEVVIGINGNPQSDGHYPADLWGNYYGATYRHYAAGDASADSLRMYYGWRANQTVSQPLIDNAGDPNSQWGYFQEPQYVGHAILHADRSATDESDDPAQPFKAGWSQRDLVKNMNEADHPTIYEYLSEPWDSRNPVGPNTYSKLVNDQGVEDPNGMYRTMRTAPGTVAPFGIDLHAFDPELEQEKNHLYSFGPYTLQPGEDVRIVTAFAAGTIPSRLAIDAGRAYDSGADARDVFGIVGLPSGRTYTDMHGNPIVQNGNVYDVQTGELIASAGDILTQAQKDRILYQGQKIMFETAGLARAVWESGNVRYGEGSFNIPFAPPAPDLEGVSENDQIRLRWTDNQGDGRGGPIVGYKIYREYKRPPALTSPHDTTFVQIAGEGCDEAYIGHACTPLPAGTTEYVDTDVVRGEDYYYYIASYNAQGIESSQFQNRTGTSATKTDEALSPTRAPDSNWQENVVVVPNPFHVQAAEKYSGRRLNFLNLPAYANIHIYTMTGDRVQTLEHDASTGDEDWERQDTFSTMEVVSGIYIYVVEELDGPRGNPTGETAIGKFVVVK